MSNIEQSEPPRDKLTPEKPDSSVETQSYTETRGELSTVEEKTGGDDSSTDESGADSDLGSTSESSDEDDSELVSSVPETPLREPTSSSSRKNLVVTQKAQVNPESTSENSPPPVENPKLASNKYTESVPDSRSNVATNMKSLRDFDLPFNRKLNKPDFVDWLVRKRGLTINKSTEMARDLLATFTLLDNRTNPEYRNILTSCAERLQTKFSISYSCQRLDDFSYELAEHVRSDLISEIQK